MDTAEGLRLWMTTELDWWKMGGCGESKGPGVPSAVFMEHLQVHCAEVGWGIPFSSGLSRRLGMWREDDLFSEFPIWLELFYMPWRPTPFSPGADILSEEMTILRN